MNLSPTPEEILKAANNYFSIGGNRAAATANTTPHNGIDLFWSVCNIFQMEVSLASLPQEPLYTTCPPTCVPSPHSLGAVWLFFAWNCKVVIKRRGVLTR